MVPKGQCIQNYRFDDRLCEGGMGTVYLGFDTKLRREVVLKTIGQAQPDGLAKTRFMREARALSKLDHPNVCRIYDFLEGEDEDYLVLERIKGQTLDVVVREGWDNRRKLRIALQLAEALVAAHQCGIVHRDLKLRNVMVTDGGQVKVLDFGLALPCQDPTLTQFQPNKPKGRIETHVGRELLKKTAEGRPGNLHTSQGSLVGTVDAMSPEQANGELVTVASDMYSFGLLLQQLFTGESCYEQNLTMGKLIVKVTHGETRPPTGIDAELIRLINKLKSKAPEHRPTAIQAFQQLKRFQQRPLRRLRKATIVAVLLVIAFGVGKHILDLDRAHKASELARLEAEQITGFMLEVFKLSDPGKARGNTITARELLHSAAQRLEADEGLNPSVKVRLILSIGEVYKNLGLYGPAENMFQNALSIAESSPHVDILLRANSLHDLGALFILMGRYPEALEHLTGGLKIREDRLGPLHPQVAHSLNRIGALYWERGLHDESEPFFQRALAIREQTSATSSADLASSLNNLGLLYRRRGDYEKAETLYRRSIEIVGKAKGFRHPDMVVHINNLGVVLRQLGRNEEAEKLYRRALGIQELTLGKQHPSLSFTLNNLALINWQLGRYEEAGEDGSRALAIREELYGSDHFKTAFPLNALGQVRWKQGRLEEAEEYLTRALQIWESRLDPGNQLLAWPLSGLAGIRRDQGRFREADGLFRRAIDIRVNALGEDHPDLVQLKKEFEILLQMTGRAGETGESFAY